MTMTTITEDYVSFETAKLLKEKRFNEECFALYNPDGVLIQSGIRLNNIQVGRVKGSYSAPTLQMTMKWLREVHQYIIEIHYGDVGSPREPKIQWWWELENKQGEFLNGNIIDGNITYEEACEAAIKYCLENLI